MADVYRDWVLYNVGKAIKNWTEYPFDWTMLSEYNALQTSVDSAKESMRISIWNKWVVVPSSAGLNEYAWYIDQIQTCWWDDVLSYMSWILAIDSWMIYINSSDGVYNKYSDYSRKDWQYLYLVKPYEYDNYSSTWASHVETYVYCMALAKWASSTINIEAEIYSGWYYTTTYIDYYYINWRRIRFYWRTWQYNDTYWCKELYFDGSSWTVNDIWRDWTTPTYTWWDQNIFYSTVVWSTSGWGNFYYKWKPN